MNARQRIMLSSLALCGLGFQVGAQRSPLPNGPDTLSVMRSSVGLERVASDELRGVGADYFVRFTPDRVAFTPALGRRASRSYPLALSFQAVRRGDVEVDAAGRDGASVDGLRAVYQRGAALREQWEVRSDGVELTYTFERPIPGSGDLIVRLGVETDLELRRVQPGREGALWTAEGIGGVRIGGVTGIDARGERAAGELRAGEGYIDLVLPARFIDSATYPLVLDPLIGTDVLVSGGVWDEARPDVAYDASKKIYLFVWQREYSVNHVVILGQRVDRTGSLFGSTVVIRDNSSVAMMPTVADLNQSNHFLVAWQEGPSLFGPWDIYGAGIAANGGAASASIPIAAGSGNEMRPDAGGERLKIRANNALVVWEEQGAGIHGAVVVCDAGVPPVVAKPFTLSTVSFDSEPAISQISGPQGRYLVVWERALFGVQAALLTRSGNILDPDHQVAFGPAESPDVDGMGDDYLVVWSQPEPGASFGERDVWGQKVVHAGNELSNSGGPVVIAGRPGFDERDPAVADLRYKYAVAWAEAEAPGAAAFAYDIGLLMLDPDTCAACGIRYTVSANGFDGYPQIARGGNTEDRGMLAVMSAPSAPPFTGEVRGQRIEAVGAGGPVINAGGGCGAAGTAATNGPAAIGNTDFAFTLSGAEPGVTVALFVLGAPGDAFACGSCQVLNPAVGVGVPVSGGGATLPVPLGCNLTLLGGTFASQWWPLGTSQSPCFLLPGASFTDRLEASVGW